MRALVLSLILCRALSAAAAAPRSCPPLPGADAVLAPGARLILGEIHGTNETQQLVAALACHATALGPLRVGLEFPSPEQPRLDAYLKSQGRPADKQALLRGEIWTHDVQDGRSSVAMLGLIEAVRALAQDKADVKLIAFDVPMQKPDVDRDLEMARTLAAAFAREPKATFVVLVGNLHARKAPHPRLKQTFMAERLVAMKQAVTTLDVIAGAGTTWNCQAECGVHRFGIGEPPPVGITLAATKDGAYDGHFSIGRPTFSPPAARRMTPEEQTRVALVELELAAVKAATTRELPRCAELYLELAKKATGAAAGDSLYNAACCLARGGDATRAFAELGAAVDRGFNDRATLESDDDLKSLHGDARWPKLLLRLPAK